MPNPSSAIARACVCILPFFHGASAASNASNQASSPAAEKPSSAMCCSDECCLHATYATSYSGNAYDTERHHPAYTEEHREAFIKDKHVETRTSYKTPEGGALGERTLDFHRFEFKPDYLYRDFRNGYEEGAKVEDAKSEDASVRVHFRDSAHAPWKEKLVEVPEPCVINGGVVAYAKAHWAELEAGKRLDFNMVIPARLDFYRFQAYESGDWNIPQGEDKGRAYKAVVVEPQSRVLRMLLPTIILYYDVKTLRLIRYQGIVDVADGKGRSLRVRIDYPDQGP